MTHVAFSHIQLTGSYLHNRTLLQVLTCMTLEAVHQMNGVDFNNSFKDSLQEKGLMQGSPTGSSVVTRSLPPA